MKAYRWIINHNILLIVAFSFFLLIPRVYAQPNNFLSKDGVHSKAMQLILEAEQLLKGKWTNQPKPTLKELCNKIDKTLDSIDDILKNHAKDLNRTTKALLDFAQEDLEARKASIKLVINGKPLPGIDGPRRCKECLKILGNFFGSEIMQEKSDVPNYKVIQSLFLVRMSICFDFFSKNPTYYQQAIDLFEDLVYGQTVHEIKTDPNRLNPFLKDVMDPNGTDKNKSEKIYTTIEERGTHILEDNIKNDPNSLETFIEHLIDSIKNDKDKFEKIRAILRKYSEGEIDVLEALKAIEDILKEGQAQDVRQVFDRMNNTLSDRPTRNKAAKMLALEIPDNMDPEIFMDPLRQFINSVQDETFLNRVFARLRDRYQDVLPNAESSQAIKQLFPNEKTDLVPLSLLNNIIEASRRIIINERQTQIIVHYALRYGKPTALKYRPYKQEIAPVLNKIWNGTIDETGNNVGNPQMNDEAQNNGDTDNSQVTELLALTVGQTYHNLDRNHSGQQTLHIIPIYQIEGNTLKLNTIMVDGSDGFMLGAYERGIELYKDIQEFKTSLKTNIIDMRNKFYQTLKGFLIFDKLLEDKSKDMLSFEQFKAYQLYGVQISVHRPPNAEKKRILFADGIFVYKPMIQKGPNGAFKGFGETLIQKLKNHQSLLHLPVYSSGSPSLYCIAITGIVNMKENPKKLSVVLENNNSEILTIDSVFSKKYDKEMDQTEKEYAADFVIETIQSLLRVNIVYPTPKKISQWRSSSSLLFAGNSQFYLADHIKPDNAYEMKRNGWIYACTEIAFLLGAAYYDHQSINSVDNDDLRNRNTFLLAAGGTAITSFIHAIFSIRRHNKLFNGKAKEFNK